MNTITKKRRSSSGNGANKKYSAHGNKITFKKRRGKFNDNKNKRYGKRKNINFSKKTFGGKRRYQRGGRRKMPTFDPSRFINTNPVDEVVEEYKPKHGFDDFGLDKRLVKTIYKMGLKSPFPIQDKVIPEMLKGNDVIGLAETGTGKTAAFLIPLIEKTIRNGKTQTLILAPTRELAIQIEKELYRLTKGFRIFSVVCVGGANIRPQINILKRNNHFIIGTPGRIIDLMKRKHFRPEKIDAVVLDEADRMLDMGFIHDMREILSRTPSKRETYLFSATITKGSEKIMQEFLNNPVTVSVKKKDITNSIEQDVVKYDMKNKYETLLSKLESKDFRRVLVFGSMKHSVEKLSRQLMESGIKAESIHGNKSHGQRQRALAKFKNGKASVLVATDVAARGIHVDNVTHVINYDLPNTFDDYVHRIGRTGRGVNKGKALTFVPNS